MDLGTATSSRPRRNRAPYAAATPPAGPTYGYHNTYHTHTQLPPGSPPSYARAVDPQVLRHLDEKARSEAAAAAGTALPPAYSCTVAHSGVMGVKQELSSPFHVSRVRDWYDAFVVLQGTQLSIFRVKNPGLLSKNKLPTTGKLLHAYTLQHAEVGVASDFRKTALIPKSPLAHLVPSATRQKLYETDPQLFEPVREHVIRLRLETEQFLLCAPSQESMLDWTDSLCAAIDISSPLEDRSEPRYRSLPRRSRRQRILDSSQLGEDLDNLSSLEAGRRIIAQQEEIIRQLYPHLAGAIRDPGYGITTTVSAGNSNNSNTEPEMDDFDPEDVRFPAQLSARDSLARARSSESDDDSSNTPSSETSEQPHHKHAEHTRPTASQNLRYRRRCAPVLLASSPRVSDVVFSNGKRMRIHVKKHTLVDYTCHPPRYDAHHFPKAKKPLPLKLTPAQATSTAPEPQSVPERPSSPVRAVTDDSITSIASFGEELLPSSSSAAQSVEACEDEVSGQSPDSSGPPSPVHAKAQMNKRVSETGLRAVVLGVGLLI
ncbi:hypothetical protein BDU57DRAFT_312896 [Ampelomyces quisqualis]|uniref:PH domain-containing protein n=1 Tax=Ampelomyces quisqualis TaxID=50730 RepID=A0A6A5QFB2_AMPQU|nr:hypothetical protein BDU57DRAFT_312896 [Ampelomyces quisqualis]